MVAIRNTTVAPGVLCAPTTIAFPSLSGTATVNVTTWKCTKKDRKRTHRRRMPLRDHSKRNLKSSARKTRRFSNRNAARFKQSDNCGTAPNGTRCATTTQANALDGRAARSMDFCVTCTTERVSRGRRTPSSSILTTTFSSRPPSSERSVSLFTMFALRLSPPVNCSDQRRAQSVLHLHRRIEFSDLCKRSVVELLLSTNSLISLFSHRPRHEPTKSNASSNAFKQMSRALSNRVTFAEDAF